MPKAVWNGTVIAESDETIIIEGSHYFPRAAIHEEYFSPSDFESICPWKGRAGYLDVTVAGDRNPDAAWFYAEPKSGATEIAGRVAFWKGVEIEA
jgi:uncharacterized protein (DUF427 family)